MQHIGIVLYLFFLPVMCIYQNKELTNNFKTVFLFLCDVQAPACDTGRLDYEAFELNAEHLFL